MAKIDRLEQEQRRLQEELRRERERKQQSSAGSVR
jgi:hypothetical protein